MICKRKSNVLPLVFGGLAWVGVSLPQVWAAPVAGWLGWRGPNQNGSSQETGLPTKVEVGGKSQLWSSEFPGQGTPVIAGGKLYAMGYVGEGADLQEFSSVINSFNNLDVSLSHLTVLSSSSSSVSESESRSGCLIDNCIRTSSLVGLQ